MSTPCTRTTRIAAIVVPLLMIAGILTACSPLQPPNALTIATTATSAEPAPSATSITDLLVSHADAALLPGDATVTVVSPDTVRTIDLTPMRGDDVENTDAKRRNQIHQNIETLQNELADTATTSDGLNFVGVLDRALIETPAGGTVVMISSALSTVAPLDLALAGAWTTRPADLVNATPATDLPNAEGRDIIFIGIGQPASNGSQPTPGPAARTALEAIVLGLCAKMQASSCELGPRSIQTAPGAATNTVPVITFDAIGTACIGDINLATKLLFEGNSPALRQDVDDTALHAIASELQNCPTGTIINAIGYTADPACTGDPNSSSGLAIARGTAILERLISLGAPAATIGDARNGGHLVNDCPGGRFDEEIAQNNRTVILTEQ